MDQTGTTVESDNETSVRLYLNGKDQGVYTLIDSIYSTRIGKYNWSLNNHGYVRRCRQGKTICLHRAVWKLRYGESSLKKMNRKGKIIDHINRNPLDNRVDNLRKVSRTENAFNTNTRKTNTSGFRGVTWSKEKQKWKSQMRIRQRMTHLGYFETKEEAARVYNKVLQQRKDIREEVKIYNSV